MNIATFNLENLDDKEDLVPDLATRIRFLRPELIRLEADILCLQEVHSQVGNDGKRQLSALNKLLKGTRYETFELVFSVDESTGSLFPHRNIIILSRYPIKAYKQYKHTLIPAPLYRAVTAKPQQKEAEEVTWERPILHAKIEVKQGYVLDIINIHLKSKNPTSIQGQQENFYTWKSASGWAEGSFLSAMRRVGQALEVRALVDQLFDEEKDAAIIVAGDMNAESLEVPVECITGRVENTSNPSLVDRELIPCESSVPASRRFSLYHQGRKNMLDNLLMSRKLLEYYRGCEVFNETLSDESLPFATDDKFPGSDHAAVVGIFSL